MPEWSIGAVSKTVVRFTYRGFESLSFRECTHVHLKKKSVTIKVTDFYLINLIVKDC